MSTKDSYLGQAWLVLVMAGVVGAALAGVYATLNERIQANAEAEALSRVPGLVPGADRGRTGGTQPEDITVSRPDGTRKIYRVYRALDGQDRQVGWVVRTSGEGFAGSIDLLVALDAQADRIVGLDVVGQKETPTVGDRVTRPDFRRKFLGRKTASPLAVVKRPPKGEDEIEAITGATISSRSVSAIVNEAVSDLRGELGARSRKKD